MKYKVLTTIYYAKEKLLNYINKCFFSELNCGELRE